MSETSFRPVNLTPGYTVGELRALTGGGQWRNLSPNFPTAQDLLPAALDALKIDATVQSILSEPYVVGGLRRGISGRQESWGEASQEWSVPGVGVLHKVGHGVSKICYELQTDEGDIAVWFGGYNANTLGLRVPHDNRLLQVDDNSVYGGRRLWEYNDVRTYLAVPVGNVTGVVFQEYGGEQATPSYFERRRTTARFRGYLGDISVANPESVEYALRRDSGHYVQKSASGATVGLAGVRVEEKIY